MSEQAVILVAEDRDDDRVFIRNAFEKANVVNPLHFVRDGEEAIAYLKGEGKYARRAEFPLPSLLLLDIKMPKVDGFEVITWIRQQKELSPLRIVVLTSSEDLPDVNKAYGLGANSFLVKPLDFERFVDITRAIKGYWLWLDKPPDVTRALQKWERDRDASQS
jgi:CheY-like chemotaxis protein